MMISEMLISGVQSLAPSLELHLHDELEAPAAALEEVLPGEVPRVLRVQPVV